MPRKIKPRALTKSPLLVSEDEKARRITVQREAFLSWFLTVPGAEWEEGSTDGMLFCRWYVNEHYPEWGKVFCAHHLGDSFESFQHVVNGHDPGFIPFDAEWDILSLREKKDAVTREEVLEAYARQQLDELSPRIRRLGTAAYGRILNELWYRQQKEKR